MDEIGHMMDEIGHMMDEIGHMMDEISVYTSCDVPEKVPLLF